MKSFHATWRRILENVSIPASEAWSNSFVERPLDDNGSNTAFKIILVGIHIQVFKLAVLVFSNFEIASLAMKSWMILTDNRLIVTDRIANTS